MTPETFITTESTSGLLSIPDTVRDVFPRLDDLKENALTILPDLITIGVFAGIGLLALNQFRKAAFPQRVAG